MLGHARKNFDEVGDHVARAAPKERSAWIERKLELYGVPGPKAGVQNMKKIVAGRKLWNYDNLEPTEKKIVL